MTEKTASAAPRGRAYRGMSPEQRLRERRQRLIDAGMRVFGTAGYRNAKVRTICREAGLTERYFYESFNGRAELFSAVYEHVAARIRDQVTEALRTTPGDVHELADAGLRAFFGILQQQPAMARVFLVEYIGAGDEMNERARQAAADFSNVVRALIQDTYNTDQLLDLDPTLLTSGLIGSTAYIGMQWVLAGYDKPLDEVVRNAMAFYMALDRELRRGD